MDSLLLPEISHIAIANPESDPGGQVELGIEDFFLADGSRIVSVAVELPLYQPIEHTLALMSNSKRKPAALTFIMLLNSSQDRPVLADYGFLSQAGISDFKLLLP